MNLLIAIIPNLERIAAPISLSVNPWIGSTESFAHVHSKEAAPWCKSDERAM